MAEAMANGGARAQAGAAEQKPQMRAAAIVEGPMGSGVRKLLERRIREYMPDAAFTEKCLEKMRYADRPLDAREKITVLAICRCYDSQRRQRTLVNYLGYLKTRCASEMDLGRMLLDFRTNPSSVLDVNAHGTWQTGKIMEELKR